MARVGLEGPGGVGGAERTQPSAPALALGRRTDLKDRARRIRDWMRGVIERFDEEKR